MSDISLGAHITESGNRCTIGLRERASSGTSLIDVLDRVLDKGIVIDAWVRVSLVGIDLIHPVEGRSSCRPSCIRR